MSHPEDFGRYRLLEPIGQGGMATVYAGEHRTLHRPVAIKVLHPHLVDEGVMARRMLEEAHTIASLHHPGIVEVIDVGLTIDGRTFMVMERLAGETLGERLHRGRLSEERAVVFARQLASALAVAHAAGVIHRDLKPDNVFIVPDPDVAGGERVKVLDFGIAKRASALREKTRTGIVLGTPAYMAPEQSTDGRDVDDRADVYALGIVIYRMVTGALPFAGADTDELFAEHAFCAPPPVASKAPVSPGLARIVERCLAKRPLDRFASMDALGAALARLDCAVAATPFEEDTSVDAGLARRRAAVAAVLPSHPDEDDEPTGQVSARQDADDTDELTAVPAVSRIATGSRARAIARRRTRMLGALAAAVPLLVVLSALLIAAATRHGDKVVPRAAEGARGESARVDTTARPAAVEPARVAPGARPTPSEPARVARAIPARPEVRPAAPPSRPGDDDGKKTAQTVIPPRARAKPAAPREPEPAPAPARPTPSSTPSKEEAFATVAPPTLY